MGIRVALLLGIALIAYYVFWRRHKLPIHLPALLAILLTAGGLVLFPDLTTSAANVLGVGRGADLISYLVDLSLLFVVIHYYTKFIEQEAQTTVCVRELAKLRAEVDEWHGKHRE